MADTSRTKTDLLTNLFQDGQTGGISANDMRDLLVSLAPPMGGFYFSSTAATTIGTAGVYVKAAGTTTSTVLTSDMTMPANNRLTFSGASPRHFHIVAQASIQLSSGTNQLIGVQIYHYDNSAGSGSLLAMSEARNTVTGTNIEQITTHGDAMLDTGDYLEIHLTNHSGTTPTVTVAYGYLFGMGVIM